VGWVLGGFGEGDEDGGGEYADDDAERDADGELVIRVAEPGVVGVGPDHLSADEHQDRREAVAEVMEQLHQAGDREEQGAEAEDGEHVGREHDEGLFGDGEDRRDGIDGEDDVGELREDQRDQERGGEEFGIDPGEELLAHEVRGNRHELSEASHDGVLFGVDLLVFQPQHFHAGEGEEDAEDEDHPAEGLQERGASSDEDGAEDERADDAPEEDSVLVLRGDIEVAEDHEEDKDVVDAQGLFHQVAGEERERGVFGRVGGARLDSVPEEVEAEIEEEGEGDPDAAPDERLLHLDGVRLAMEDAKVEREHARDERQEGAPDPDWNSCNHVCLPQSKSKISLRKPFRFFLP